MMRCENPWAIRLPWNPLTPNLASELAPPYATDSASTFYCQCSFVFLCFPMFPFVSLCFLLFPFVFLCFPLFPFVSLLFSFVFLVFLFVSFCFLLFPFVSLCSPPKHIPLGLCVFPGPDLKPQHTFEADRRRALAPALESHQTQAGSLLSVATEAYVCELERCAPASGARLFAARDIMRGTYGEKIEVPEACLWASKTRSGLRSASFRNHRRVFDGTPGPGLRLYACKFQRCAGALDQGPEKHTTPKEYVSEGNKWKQRETKGNKGKQKETKRNTRKTNENKRETKGNKRKRRETKGNTRKQKETQGNRGKQRNTDNKMCWHCRWHKVAQALTQDWA